MNKSPIKINKSEILKTDSKIEFFNEIIENSITSKSEILYKEASTYCGIECNKCFEICDDIINFNPHYIQAYLKKIRCKKRNDAIDQLKECEDLLNKFPQHCTKINFCKLSIVNRMENNEEQLRYILNELYKLTDLEIDDNYGQLAYGFDCLNMHNEAIECYTKHLTKHPMSFFVFINRGNVLDKIGRYEDAISDLKKGIELIKSSKDSIYQESLNKFESYLLILEGKLAYKNDNLTF